jgi:hypothetical protein
MKKSPTGREIDRIAEEAWKFLDNLALGEILEREDEVLGEVRNMLSPLGHEDRERYLDGIHELLTMKREALRDARESGGKLSELRTAMRPETGRHGYLHSRRRSCDTCIYFGFPGPLQCFNPRRKRSTRPIPHCRLYRKGISVDRMLLMELAYNGPGPSSWKDYLEFLAGMGIRFRDLLWDGDAEPQRLRR